MPGTTHSPEYSFNEDRPAGDTKGYDADNWIRSNQKHVDGAYGIEHYAPSNDPDASEDDFGRHDFITLKKQTTKPDLSGSSERVAIYYKADGIYTESTGGTEIMLVSAGGANKAFPTDTVMAFGNNSAPTGWTRLTTGDTIYDAATNNAMFCFAKSGNIAQGGSNDPQAATTGSTTLTAAQSGLPAHGHTVTNATYGTGAAMTRMVCSDAADTGNFSIPNCSEASASEGHTHPTAPYYVELILAKAA